MIYLHGVPTHLGYFHCQLNDLMDKTQVMMTRRNHHNNHLIIMEAQSEYMCNVWWSIHFRVVVIDVIITQAVDKIAPKLHSTIRLICLVPNFIWLLWRARVQLVAGSSRIAISTSHKQNSLVTWLATTSHKNNNGNQRNHQNCTSHFMHYKSQSSVNAVRNLLGESSL